MGTCTSSAYKRLQREDAEQIGIQLSKERRTFWDEKSVLLLGACDSGKSTIMRQLRTIYGSPTIHDEPLTRHERRVYIPRIHKQCIEQMRMALTTRNETILLVYGFCHDTKTSDDNERISLIIPDDVQRLIIQYAEGFDVNLSSNGNMAAECIQSTYPSVNVFNDEIVAALKTLWNESAIRSMYERRNITGIDDSSAYFWDYLDTINDPEYVPDEADILLIYDKYIRKGMSLIHAINQHDATQYFKLPFCLRFLLRNFCDSKLLRRHRVQIRNQEPPLRRCFQCH